MHIVIKSVTKTGEQFGNNNLYGWADRIAFQSAKFTPNRPKPFSMNPHIHSRNDEQGNSVLIISGELKEADPKLFKFIMKFVQLHNLEYSEVSDE